MSRALPSFDLVVATVGRVSEFEGFLDSLEIQTYRGFRVVVVDQNDDDRLLEALGRRSFDLMRLTSERGLSRARNAALERLTGDVVGFPDDDCVYPPELVETLAQRFAEDSTLDGLSVRIADKRGASDAGWGRSPVRIEKTNVWNLVASAGLFLRRPLIDLVGPFDELIGIGSSEPWSSGEETDFVIRALELGARIEYDPMIVVEHELRRHDAATAGAQGFREGASVGYLLRKHGYPARTLARMAVRPVAGAAVSLARLDTVQARFYVATLRGRLRGYFGTSCANSSA